MNDSIVKDMQLARSGQKKIDWVAKKMPVLSRLLEEYKGSKPFSKLKIGMSIHLEAKTAYLADVLKKCGAEVFATGCNTLSTQDDVAAALAERGVHVFAKHGVSEAVYIDHLNRVAERHPDLFIDDGGDLIKVLIPYASKKWKPLGGCEETTTGIMNLQKLLENNELICPMMNVNDADCKHLFDNRYGTGQSVWTAIMGITNTVVAGKTVVIAGYGWCGKGAAMRAKGLGARVVVTEIDQIKAIEAAMDGFEVMKMDEAVKIADYILTETGCKDVLRKKHFLKMKDGVILANGGHFDVEINLKELRNVTEWNFDARENIREYVFSDGRRIDVLAEGKLVNLAGGDGHPAEIMDMSFSVQFLSLLYLLENAQQLKGALYDVPEDINEKVAKMKLDAMGIEIDKLTKAQEKYYFV